MSRRTVTEKFVDESMEQLKSSLLDTVTLEISKSVDALKNNIINQLVEENKRLSRKCKKMSENIEHLHDEVNYLYDKVYDIEINLNDSQQRSRRNNFEIAGIPNHITDTALESTCISILNNIVEVAIKPKEIEACHRLQSKSNGAKPVIIKMMSRKRTLEIKEKKNKLSEVDLTPYDIQENTKLYINDNLSPFFKTTAFYCRDLKRKGFISKYRIDDTKIKVLNSSGKGWTIINHEQVLMDMFPNFDFD